MANAAFWLSLAYGIALFFLIVAGLTHHLLKRRFVSPGDTEARFRMRMAPYLWSARRWRQLVLASAMTLLAGGVLLLPGGSAGPIVMLAGWLVLGWTACSLSIRRSWARFRPGYEAVLAQASGAQRHARYAVYAVLAKVALAVAAIEALGFVVLWPSRADRFPFLPVFLLLPLLQGVAAWLVLRHIRRQ